MAKLKPDDFNLQLVDWINKQIFYHKSYCSSLSRELTTLWGSKRLRDKVVHFLKRVFPSPQFLSTKYSVAPNSKRIYLYYPIRLKDLLVRHCSSAWRLLFRDEKIITQAQRENALCDWMTAESLKM